MEYPTEATNKLRQTGWNEMEIWRLERLRKQLSGSLDLQDDVDTFRHLQFMRWLVTTGRLTEQKTESQR